MLRQLLKKITQRDTRRWTEVEVRELIIAEDFEKAKIACLSLHPATANLELVKGCLLAEILFRTHKDAEAETLYQDVLKQSPGFADAHYGLSLLLHARQDFESAYKHALFASGSAANDSRYLAQLGLCQICLGNYSQAEDSLRRALQHAPRDKASWNNLGISLLSKGKLESARGCFINALNIDSTFTQAQSNLNQLLSDPALQQNLNPIAELDEGPNYQFVDLRNDAAHSLEPDPESNDEEWHEKWRNACNLAKQGRHSVAFDAIEELLMEFPNSAELAVLTDRLYRSTGDSGSGLAVLQAFLARHPSSALAHQGLGEALLILTDYAEAEAHLKKALDLGLCNQPLIDELARCIMKQDRYIEALPFRIECQTKWPSDINLANLAIAYYHICDYQEALSLLEDLKKNNLIDRLGLELIYAQTLLYGGHVSDAIRIIDSQIARHGKIPHLLNIRSLGHLLTEEFAEGWDGYRFRQGTRSHFRVLPFPEWQGESLEGKRVVVLAEQGLGDQVMFASCLPDLLKMGPAEVIVEVIDRVAATISRSFPECKVIATKQDKKMDWLRGINDVDYFIPLGELPRHFRRDLASFPMQAYLLPDATRVENWRTRLEALGPGPYLGLSWRGGTELTRRTARSLSPDLLHPLTSAIPSRWISLQYGDVKDDLANASSAGIDLVNWPEAILDLDDFAALCAALDGVFTVCNTTVHYAGAVGQKVWVLAPNVPEWRYGLHNRNMPWYPNVEVLRQPRLNGWDELIVLAKSRLIDNFCQDPMQRVSENDDR